MSIGHAIKTRAQHQGATGFTVFFQFIFAGHGFAACVENFAMHQPPLPPRVDFAPARIMRGKAFFQIGCPADIAARGTLIACCNEIDIIGLGVEPLFWKLRGERDGVPPWGQYMTLQGF